MASATKFVCDFCYEPITDKATLAGQCGFCLKDNQWTRNLTLNLHGPHICLKCIMSLNSSDAVKK